MPDRRRFERGPDTLGILVALALGGAIVTVFNVAPASVAAIAPPPLALAWSAGLAIGASVALVGVLAHSPVRGWALEAIGRGVLSPILLGYAVALGNAATNPGTWFLVVLFAALAIASAVRVFQAVRRVFQFRAALQRAIS